MKINEKTSVFFENYLKDFSVENFLDLFCGHN